MASAMETETSRLNGQYLDKNLSSTGPELLSDIKSALPRQVWSKSLSMLTAKLPLMAPT